MLKMPGLQEKLKGLKKSDIFFIQVADRKSKTLIEIIRAYIEPNLSSTLIYKRLDEEDGCNFIHITANHSKIFKDPETRVL